MEGAEKRFLVRIMPSARERMAAHFEFLARVSVAAAERLLQTLLSDAKSLEYLPKRHPVYQPTGIEPQKYRFMISAKRYRILYQIIGGTVFIDDIQDCRQNDDKNIVSTGRIANHSQS